MTNTAVHATAAQTPTTAFRRIKTLVSAYTALSVSTFAGLFATGGAVGQPVWIRLGIVAATSLILLSITLRTARGSHAAYRRLRIISTVLLAATTAVIALPGMFPTWMRVEQAACAALLAGIVLTVHGRTLRAHFTK